MLWKPIIFSTYPKEAGFSALQFDLLEHDQEAIDGRQGPNRLESTNQLAAAPEGFAFGT
jgi:hypothetical protein